MLDTLRYLGQFAILGLAIAFLATNLRPDAKQAPAAEQTTASEITTQLPPTELTQSFADAVGRASPVVVNIYARRLVQQVARDPQVSRFTGGGLIRGPVVYRSELGAGVIGSADGHIITNLHIVNGAREIWVGLYDNRVVRAEPIGQDPATDLAVLKINAEDLPTAPIGDTGMLRIGDIALAIGNPFGLGKTVTMGIVSATGRGDLEVSDYAELIQTDAAINRGNSGGALINSDGELIGINTAVLDQQDAEGIGFAIPIETALDVMSQLIETGVVTRGWFGVQWNDGRIHPDLRQAANQQQGHVIGNMMPDGPAHRAGLQRGDYVVRVNDQPVGKLRDLLQIEAATTPGSTITVDFWREGALLQTQATLIQRPPRLRG